MDTAYHHNQHPRRWPRAHRRSSVRTNVLLIAFGPCGEAQYPHTNVLSSEVALFTFFFYMPFHSRADSLCCAQLIMTSLTYYLFWVGLVTIMPLKPPPPAPDRSRRLQLRLRQPGLNVRSNVYCIVSYLFLFGSSMIS